MEMVARDDADVGRFFMGKPCKRGHGGKRYTNGKACVECSAANSVTPKTKAQRRTSRHTPEGTVVRASYKRLSRYGMLPGEYNFMLAGQQYRCAICGVGTPGGWGTWHVDHCHVTGRVRGLLCQHCNTGLGHFKDSPEQLSAAIEYLNAA